MIFLNPQEGDETAANTSVEEAAPVEGEAAPAADGEAVKEEGAEDKVMRFTSVGSINNDEI